MLPIVSVEMRPAVCAMRGKSRPSSTSSAVPCHPVIVPSRLRRGDRLKLPVRTSIWPGWAFLRASASAASSAVLSCVCTVAASAAVARGRQRHAQLVLLHLDGRVGRQLEHVLRLREGHGLGRYGTRAHQDGTGRDPFGFFQGKKSSVGQERREGARDGLPLRGVGCAARSARRPSPRAPAPRARPAAILPTAMASWRGAHCWRTCWRNSASSAGVRRRPAAASSRRTSSRVAARWALHRVAHFAAALVAHHHETGRPGPEPAGRRRRAAREVSER